MNERVDELLIHYEELRDRGAPISPGELCRDCPELLAEIKRQLAALASVNELLSESLPDGGASASGAELPRIPGFEILQELGRGGMGVVYKARQISLKRLVALKMILAGSHASPAQLARFRTEAETIARIRHPHILQIHDVGAHEGKPYLVLEYVEGISLDKQLQTPWAPQEAAALAEQLARAVHAAHQAGIIHRDLKPANVLLQIDKAPSSQSLIPKITDFGLAKQLDGSSGQTQSGVVVGTPSYMAPEQADGRIHESGPWTDIYALGAVLYEMLTGQPPFKGHTPLATLDQVRSLEPTPPSRLQPGVPRDLEIICLQALHKEPGRRYHSAEDMADDLQRFVSGAVIEGRPDPVLQGLWRWLRRDERIRDTGLVMLINAGVRGAAIIQMRNLASVDLEQEPWLPVQMAVWLIGMCLALFWAGWRTLGRHVIAIWAGFFLAAVYLGTRSVSTFLEAQDERIFLYSLLFAVQLLACSAALLAYYSKHH